MKLLDHIDTFANPRGLCSLNTEGDDTIIACPDKTQGHVSIHFYGESKTNIIKAHQSALSAIELNQKGSKLATCSEKGTLIRIYNTFEGIIIQEMRRGKEYAQIYSLAFDLSGRWISLSSDQGTIHVFNITLTQEEYRQTIKFSIYLIQITLNPIKRKNPESKLKIIGKIIPYFNSEWSFAQFKTTQDSKTKVGFAPELGTLVILSYNGIYQVAKFDPEHGGEAVKSQEIINFISKTQIKKNVHEQV